MTARQECALERLDVAVYLVPTDSPEADGTLTWNETTVVLVEAYAGGALGTGWTYGAAAAGSLVRDLLAAQVLTRSAMDIPAAHAAMSASVRNVGRPGIAATAISAVDTALWDLKARLLDLPLCALLGAVRTKVPVYGSGGFTSYDDARLAAQLRHWVEDDGISRVKIKIGESWGTCESRDLARMRLARKVVGDGPELYVDANGAYERKQAIRVLQRAADLDIRWYEEPVSSDDLAGLREVRDAVSADVAAGEYGWAPHDFRRLCATGAVDCLQADVTRCGGITGFLHAAALAEAYTLPVSAHCAPQLHAHVGVAVPNVRHVEWFHDHVRIERMFFDGALPPTGGWLIPDRAAPGHGLTLHREIERFRVA